MRSARMTIPLVTLAVTALGSAQEPAPAPRFPATAGLVRLDLAVRDKAGRPVDDLRADEVLAFEDGKPSAVESFRPPLGETDDARQRTTVFKRALRLPPTRYVLETAVQDRESGRPR